MVPAGAPVDAAIASLKPYLQAGDLIIDGGNSYFLDTERRVKELAQDGLHFIGMGVSGGESGALWGPSMMPGGSSEAWPRVQTMFEAIAAKAEDGEACVAWMGSRRRRTLCQDGAQRHRVRRYAAHRRDLRPAAPRRGHFQPEAGGDLRRLESRANCAPT